MQEEIDIPIALGAPDDPEAAALEFSERDKQSISKDFETKEEIMKEKFPEITPEKEQKIKVKLPENVRDDIYRKEEFDYSIKDYGERRVDTIEKWLLTASTREELDEMIELLRAHTYEHIGVEGGEGEAAEILGEVLKNVLFKNRKNT